MIKKGTSGIPSDLYGPYIRSDKNDKWHSVKSCSGYPTSNEVEIKYFSSYPVVADLCPECLKIEKISIKY